jgi:hypothetical protein
MEMMHPADIMQHHACFRVLMHHKSKDMDHVSYAHDEAIREANCAMGLNWNQRKMPHFESKSDEDELVRKWVLAYWDSVERWPDSPKLKSRSHPASSFRPAPAPRRD